MDDATVATAEQELAALAKDAEKLHLCEFWSEIRKLEVPEPKPIGDPYVWRFKEIHPHLLRAAQVVPVEEAERRAVVFRNPGLGGRIATTQTLYAAYSIYNPNEHAAVHRHTPTAGRIGLVGTGGYTTVEGQKCLIQRGDLVLTPNWTWHDHGNEGTEENIWFDILDVPLSIYLGAILFDFDYAGPSKRTDTNVVVQSPTEIIDSENNQYAFGGLVPRGSRPRPTGPGLNPIGPSDEKGMFLYRWDNTRSVLERAKKGGMDEYEGITVRLVNPHTGAFLTPTIDYRAMLLPRDASTKPMREMASKILLVLEGKGYTKIGDQRYEWEENDVLCIPNWMWHEHVNTSSEQDAVLYTMSDFPIFSALGLYSKQTRDSGGHISWSV